MSPAQRAVWAMTRVQGRQRYIWRFGVCQWGLFMYLAMSVAPAYLKYFQQGADKVDLWLGLLNGAIIWLLGGYWFGKTTWAQNERLFWASPN